MMSQTLRRCSLAAVIPLALAAMAGTAQAATAAGGAGLGGNGAAVINGAARFQQISGFGASEAFGQAQTVMNAPAAVQEQALGLLYGPQGAGLTILRNELPSEAGSTIEPAAPASPSSPPSYVPLSATGDDNGQLWFAQQIREDFGVRQVFADAWSAPAFMKTNDSTDNGGTLCGVPGASCASGDWRQAFADYMVQYARDYAQAGIPLEYIGFENEANLAPSYTGMIMSPAQTANFAGVVGPTLARSGLPTRLECCATEGWDYAASYAAAIESDPAAYHSVSLFTSHGYTQAPASPLPGWTKPVWETEWSTFQSWDPSWDDGTTASGFSWAQNIYTGLTSANLDAFLYWWGSSTTAENGDNEGLILINGDTVTPSGRLWAFANYSRFVRPGAVRIGATSPDSSVEVTAFRNVNGSVAIVALNTATTAQTLTFAVDHTRLPGSAVAVPFLTDATSDTAAQAPIRVQGGSFTATLPARSLVTYDIRG